VYYRQKSRNYPRLHPYSAGKGLEERKVIFSWDFVIQCYKCYGIPGPWLPWSLKVVISHFTLKYFGLFQPLDHSLPDLGHLLYCLLLNLKQLVQPLHLSGCGYSCSDVEDEIYALNQCNGFSIQVTHPPKAHNLCVQPFPHSLFLIDLKLWSCCLLRQCSYISTDFTKRRSMWFLYD
jgi:hypothetical protein